MTLIKQILPSSRAQIQVALDRVLDAVKKNISILSYSFKERTDNLRQSPMRDPDGGRLPQQRHVTQDLRQKHVNLPRS